MQNCLGIYFEENLIKYAKVSKERDEMKVESFGIRFFEDLTEEIEKIIEETYSFSTPISINLSNEKYLYFDIFSLLNKKDIEKTIQTEFESFCEEKNYNSNAFENRYALMPNQTDSEKIRALDIFINKIEMNRQKQPFEKYKLTKMMPVSIAIGNIARLNKKENQLIINMEDTTTVTTIYDNQIYNVDVLDIGSKEILENINKIENSYAKAYDICKNTTIYTAEMEDSVEEQPYLQNIMPTIYKIAEKVQEIVTSSEAKIQTIYLTGNLSVINNIDLYFQEFFTDIECKILKPNIIDEAVTKINIKDYIEVNSAIALATVGLGQGIQELNFQKAKTGDKLSQFLKIEMPNGKVIGGNTKIDFSLKGALTTVESWLLRCIIGLLLILIIYTIFSKVLANQMLNKEDEIKRLIAMQNSQISSVNSDETDLNAKTEKYKNLIADLKRINEKLSDAAARRNSIPNLLNQIMYNIPNKVELTSIENTSDKSISITAQSYEYDQLGYFKAVLQTKKILKNVVSTSGVKSGDIITFTIEGELP
ncbi:MAG: hypothetical protein IJK18_07495 [Clostridia bacterium]|nr:hypothetical protein [Clostridia bacterium]